VCLLTDNTSQSVHSRKVRHQHPNKQRQSVNGSNSLAKHVWRCVQIATALVTGLMLIETTYSVYISTGDNTIRYAYMPTPKHCSQATGKAVPRLTRHHVIKVSGGVENSSTHPQPRLEIKANMSFTTQPLCSQHTVDGLGQPQSQSARSLRDSNPRLRRNPGLLAQ
jgi:hypothetical protein